MGRCCGRSSGGCWVPASVLLGRKRLLGNPALFWTATCAAVTRGAVQRSLDCCLRRKDTVAPSPGHPGRLATLSRRGRGVLAPLVCHSRESGNPVVSFWTAACAGMTPRGIPKGAWIPAFAGMTQLPPHPEPLLRWGGQTAGFRCTPGGWRNNSREGKIEGPGGKPPHQLGWRNNTRWGKMEGPGGKPPHRLGWPNRSR